MREVGARLGQRLRDPEIEDLDQRSTIQAPRHEQVRRLEIAMDDARRVRLGQRHTRLQHVLDRGRERQRRVRDAALEVDARQHLHHDVRRTGLEPAHIAHVTDMFGAEAHDRACFAQEALDDRRALRHLVAEVRRTEDHAHATGAEDLIDPEPAADDGPDANRRTSIGYRRAIMAIIVIIMVWFCCWRWLFAELVFRSRSELRIGFSV